MEVPGDTVWMTSAALDDRVSLDELAGVLPWPVLRRDAVGALFAPSESARLHVFQFGALVFEGQAGGEVPVVDRFSAATLRTVLPETRESYAIRVDPETSPVGGRVGWDQIALPERTGERMGAIALLLAQSAALERFERATDRVLSEVHATARDLATRGRPPRRTRALVRRLGGVLADRLALARWFFLVDRPEATWEKPEIAALYDALFQNLELKERHEAMLHKLQAAESGLQATMGLWNGVWGLRLEWAIVILILVEIVLAVGGWF